MRVKDYVRTPRGITKIIDIRDEIIRNSANGNEVVMKTNRIITDNDISVSNDYKSSPNIIDLIEVGDYVNGMEVIELATNIDGKVIYLETDITEFDNVYACGNINIYEKDIKSIVTKEQIEEMEYKIND